MTATLRASPPPFVRVVSSVSPVRKDFVKKEQGARFRADNDDVPRRVPRCLLGALLVGVLGLVNAPSVPAAAIDNSDWLGIVNTYRAMSGLAPVAAEPAWEAGAVAHSCYMIQNDISHGEVPGRPGYSAAGHTAGMSGNVAVSGSTAADARSHIDLWMTGPFHAIGILRYNLRKSAYGECENESMPRWRSGATLDVLRGIDQSVPRPANPIVFPGDGATVPLYRFVVESPDPLGMCGWTGLAGLPLIAMMPNSVNAATAALTGPDGPLDTCTLHAGNVSDPTAKSILGADNAVVVMPRAHLTNGTYHATVNTNAGAVSWSFKVNINGGLQSSPPSPAQPQKVETTQLAGDPVAFLPNAPYRLVDTRIGQGAKRLTGGKVTRIAVADPDVSAVSANFVAVGASAAGYLTAYNCTDERPTSSMLGYQPGQAIANQSVVPLDRGALCLFSKADVDVVIDVNGTYRDTAGAGFVPIQPRRVYHTESLGRPLADGEERAIQIAGNGAPYGAEAVALNVTAVGPTAAGFVRVYPCGAPSSSEISTINYLPGDIRPNSVVVPLDGAGRVCVRSKAATNLIVDITGYFADQGLTFQPMVPLRMFDSREHQPELNSITAGAAARADQVLRVPIAGVRGVPAGAKAVTVNLTATQAEAATYLTAFPCGARPTASNLNAVPTQVSVANGAVVQLSPDGELCVYVKNPVHVIIDVNGVWL
ncbi:MAG TPA: hypothetical protein VNQ73_05845 [Ilumatobacter sp.]|nr:hypothetical protein [Ilumatobacter sp.]